MRLMLKLAVSLCNLDCPYTYSFSKEKLPGRPEQWRISEKVLESFIRKNIEGQNCKKIYSIWQGGLAHWKGECL